MWLTLYCGFKRIAIWTAQSAKVNQGRTFVRERLQSNSWTLTEEQVNVVIDQCKDDDFISICSAVNAKGKAGSGAATLTPTGA